MSKLKVVSMDPSLLNWGLAIFELDTDTLELVAKDLKVIQVKPSKDKKLRKSTKDITRVQSIIELLLPYLEDADVIVAEAPIGGRDTSSAFSYAVCISVISTISVAFTEVFTVTPFDVKKVVKKEASKDEMITWAFAQHPEAPWVFRKQKGNTLLVKSHAEHVSDAIAALYAAAEYPTFLNLIESKSK